ncbi:MAG: MFS transporter [Candidatus Solibacter sp.]
MSNPWLNCPGLPAGAAAAMASLHLSEPRPEALDHLTPAERAAGLDFCHHAGIALLARGISPDHTARDAANNLLRLRTLEATYRQLAALPIDFLALKGITQCDLFGIRPEDRGQSDIDLYCPRETVLAACDALVSSGYQPIAGLEAFPTDHLPALIRPTTWQWRGDFFDPDMPLAVELHFQFWNPQLERLPAEGIDEFWTRRVRRTVAGAELNVLYPQDAIAYSALHLLKHVLHGDTKPFHVYEIASFLHRHAAADPFWNEWHTLHSESLRRLQTVSFLLAEAWFGCRLAPAVREQAALLPAATRIWFEEFALAPAVQRLSANKDELWLHLSLLDSAADRWDVARRRLIPSNLPPPARATSTSGSRQVYVYWFLARLRHHIISLGTTLTSGARWWWRTNQFGARFWLFVLAAVLFNTALFIFYLLYNLYLVELGFGMGIVGEISAAARAGSLAGTLPGAWIAHRFGLRAALAGTIGATAAIILARSVIAQPLALSALAFAGGAAFAVWAVAMAPVIAAAVGERRRTQAFSLFFAIMFATGIAGNWVAGLLPGVLGGTQPALLFSGALAALALWPALRLQTAVPEYGSRIYPRDRFLLRFLAPFALWHLATGAFNPFGNVYFSQLKFRVEEIGVIFSGGQVVQVIAVLYAPMLIRRFGLATGIAVMMAATAMTLGGLAAQFSAEAAVVGYAAYMAFQWMSEPGLNTLLMNHVEERERAGASDGQPLVDRHSMRAGASALTYLVAFGAQAVAAYAAGQLMERFGFGPVLAGAAVLAALAALGFRLGLDRQPGAR